MIILKNTDSKKILTKKHKGNDLFLLCCRRGMVKFAIPLFFKKNLNNFKMKKLITLLLMLINILIINRDSFSQSTQWTNFFNNLSFTEFANTATDNSGNIYYCGSTAGGIPTMSRFWKYNSSGTMITTGNLFGPFVKVPNWKGTKAYSIKADNSGNFYVAGATDSANYNYKGYLAKYSTTGDSIWKRYTGINDNVGYVEWYDMKLDNAGNIYLAGINNIPGFTQTRYIISKFNSNGDLIWQTTYAPASNAEFQKNGFNIMFDNSGNIYVSSTVKIAGSINFNYGLIKFNSSGVYQSIVYFNGTGNGDDILSSSAIDNSGNIYLYGKSYQSAMAGDVIACVKYNSNLVFQWSYFTGIDQAFITNLAGNVATGLNNDVYITGRQRADAPNYGYGFLVKLNSNSGSEVFRKRLESFNDDMFTDVKVTLNGTVYVTGALGHESPNNTMQTRAYTTAGDSLWSVSLNSVTDQRIRPFNLNMGLGNEIFVSGLNDVSVSDVRGFISKISTLTGVTNTSNFQGSEFSLSQNYPNPFNPSTEIKFRIAKSSYTTLKVYDVIGKKVAELMNKELTAGEYEITFNGRNLNSGIYFYRLESGGFTETKRMILIK